jgi:predicted nucleotide-binding protein
MPYFPRPLLPAVNFTPEIGREHACRVQLSRVDREHVTVNDDQVGPLTRLEELLTFGGFTPMISIETETVSKPVPDKVMDEMRTCSAAVIHVGAEQKMMDVDGKEHQMLNQNVLIEIGAAMALYGRKFIMLVEKGAKLPSNLQGLYEVRYEGGKLDYESTMRPRHS